MTASEDRESRIDLLAKALGIPTLYLRKSLQPGGRCPHCSTPNPTFDQWWITNGTVENSLGGSSYVWATYFCTACGGAILARGAPNEASSQGAITQLIPHSRTAHDDLPPVARTFLQQAMETLHAPDAAAVMAGSAVDAMLKNLGYETGTVYSRINEAVSDHKITESMGDWAHEVRLGSNRPRHADAENPHVSSAEAAQSVEFAEALGYFLFVLSKRVERGKNAAEEASKDAASGDQSPST